MESALKLEIGEAQIQNAIAVAVAESFSPERQAVLLRDLIRAHMSVTKDSYSKETLLSETVGQHLREIAKSELARMFEEKRPQIAELVRQTLGPSFMDDVCKRFEAALSHVVVSSVNISVDLERGL